MAASRALIARGSCWSRACLNQKLIFFKLWRPFSSANIAVKRNQEESSFIITESNPEQHVNSHLGQFYAVPKDIINNVLKNILPKKFMKQSPILEDTCIMVRRPALDVIQQLKHHKPQQAPPKVIFYGEPGCGKSLSLAHVVHYAAESGWFILLVPSVFSWVHSKKGNIQMSKTREGRFNQPEESAAWLKTIRAINGDFLSKITTSQQYTWGKLDSTSAGVSLLSVIDQGLKRINYAPDVVGVVLKEIKQAQSLKVLYAVDEYNGFFGRSSFKDSKEKWIKPRNLSLVHHFTKLLDSQEGLKNAAMVFSLSRTGIERNENKSCQVKHLLGERGDSTTRPYTSVHVPEYSLAELEAYIRFYQQKGGFSKELTTSLVKEIAMLTGGQAHLVSLLCGAR